MVIDETNKYSALVGIVPRKNLWAIIQEQKWYHIPIESAPKDAELAKYLGFYFFDAFGEDLCYQIKYYAKVRAVTVVKRIELFPQEPEHARANKDYLQFHLGKIEELPKSIPSNGQRRIIHIMTSYEKLLKAKEINDLYNTSPLEDMMYSEMKNRNMAAERQYYIKVGEKEYYCLDFGIFCQKGNINIECDGEKYHTLPEALTKDRERNNELTSRGWQVLRFSGKEINQSMDSCFVKINRTIKNLGGISKSVAD